MEDRSTKLETCVEYISREVVEIRSDIHDLRKESQGKIEALTASVASAKVWGLLLYIGFAATLLGVMGGGYRSLAVRQDDLANRMISRQDEFAHRMTSRMDELTNQMTSRQDELRNQLTSRVDGLTSRMDGLTSRVDELASRQDKMTEQLTALVAAVNGLATRIK